MAQKDTRPIANIIRTREDDNPDRVGKAHPERPFYVYRAYDVADGNRLLHTYRTEALEPADDDDPYTNAIDNGLSVIGALLESMGYRITTPLKGATINRTLKRFRRALRHNTEAQLEIERAGLYRMGQQEIAQHGVGDAH